MLATDSGRLGASIATFDVTDGDSLTSLFGELAGGVDHVLPSGPDTSPAPPSRSTAANSSSKPRMHEPVADDGGKKFA
jgi:hypothetical protein